MIANVAAMVGSLCSEGANDVRLATDQNVGDLAPVGGIDVLSG